MLIAIQVSPKLISDTAAGSYALLPPRSDRYGPNAGRARKFAIVNSPIDDGQGQERAAQQGDAQVREDHLPEQDPEPAGAQALGRLRQGLDVDRPQAGVDRPVHVRERQDHVRRTRAGRCCPKSCSSAATARRL